VKDKRENCGRKEEISFLLSSTFLSISERNGKEYNMG
jgi:hypothetical protein